jgi:transcriptional repressor NrdR
VRIRYENRLVSDADEPAIFDGMRCPFCSTVDDKVIDSRAADDGASIRRRRECFKCSRRFTTFERVEDTPIVVVKRNGSRQHFDRAKLLAGLRSATKNLAIDGVVLEGVASEVEEQFRVEGAEISTGDIGAAVLQRLRTIDGVAYVRFASVYQNFTDPAEFARVVDFLASQAASPKERRLTKSTRPKPVSTAAESAPKADDGPLPHDEGRR